MGTLRKTTTLDGKRDGAGSQSAKKKKSSNNMGGLATDDLCKKSSNPIRGLAKKELGGVIFGCTNDTMKECLEKGLFGSTARHMEYVKHIRVGFPLFLFNYSTRTLYGVFTASSKGRWNIDPHGWTSDPSTKTKFPAQVRVWIGTEYRSIREKKFKPIIAGNYYGGGHFHFELEHEQVRSLAALFEAHGFKGSALPKGFECDEPESKNESGSATPRLADHGWGGSIEPPSEERNTSTSVWARSVFSQGVLPERSSEISYQALDNEVEEEASRSTASKNMSSEQLDQVNKTPSISGDDDSGLLGTLNNEKVAILLQKVLEQDNKIDRLEERLVQSDRTIGQLCDQVKMLMTKLVGTSNQLPWCGNANPTETIFLVGGINENGSLYNLGAYLPSRDNLITLAPPPSPRASPAVVCLNGILYMIGGKNTSSESVAAVESYSPATNSWSRCPSLSCEKDHLAGASLQGKLFVLGGLGARMFSDVEMYDPVLGRWIVIGSMLQKRFGHSVVELNGAMYVAGGHDIKNCLQTVERYDPRDVHCVRLKDMLMRRAYHNLTVLNDKIYAVGGWDGENCSSSVEQFDPRLGTWVMVEAMNSLRGCAAAAVLGSGLYVIGGVSKIGDGPLDSVEYFTEGQGWQHINSSSVGKRYMHSAAVMQLDDQGWNTS